MVAVVQISDVTIEGTTNIGATLNVSGSWGHSLTDRPSVNVSALNAAQVLTALKNRVINWAASPDGGGVTITASQVWVFGAPS